MYRTIFAFTAVMSSLASGCAPTWPRHAVAVVAAAGPGHSPLPAVKTIDVLPIDIQLWAEAGANANLADVASTASMNILNATLDAFSAKQIQLTAMIDRHGEYRGQAVLPRDQLAKTMGMLAGYGTMATRHPRTLPMPRLPARLGAVTGADATLYVGGWGFVATPRPSRANKIGAVVTTGMLVAAVALASPAVLGALAPGCACDSPSDAGTPPPAPPEREDLVWPAAGPSQLYLEMTLIDNRTGLALWHAHQTFPANAWTADAGRAARVVLATLPATFR